MWTNIFDEPLYDIGAFVHPAVFWHGVVHGAGHRAGRRLLRSKSVDEEFTTAVVDAAIMSLLGLLIAFTFSKAYSRYEKGAI